MLPTPNLDVISFSKEEPFPCLRFLLTEAIDLEFLLLFIFLELVFDRLVNFFNVDELEALLLDTLLAYLEPLGPLT